MGARRRRVASEIGSFLREYGRSSRKRNGYDPNDRTYDRKMEALVKKLPPEELDRLIRGDEEENDGA